MNLKRTKSNMGIHILWVPILILLTVSVCSAQLTLRPGDWVDINVGMAVTSGTVTAVSWATSVPHQFAEPSIALVGSGQSRLTCKKKAAECNLTGIYGAGFNGAVASYRFVIPSGSGPWTLKITKKSVTGGVTVLSIKSGITVDVSPKNVTVAPGQSVQFSATVTGTSNTGWTTPNPAPIIPPPDTVTIRIRP